VFQILRFGLCSIGTDVDFVDSEIILFAAVEFNSDSLVFFIVRRGFDILRVEFERFVPGVFV